jgi:uncharacterized protein GlcG (DUF336 family)
VRTWQSPVVGLLAALSLSCSSASRSPADTQGGSAGEQSRGPRAGAAAASCEDLPSASDLRQWLRRAPTEGGPAGGLMEGRFEWVSIVNRAGEVCETVVSTDDPGAAWPGSQAIAKSKAYTANAFSTDTQPMSTARLYTLAQPGHSLFGIVAGNPFSPECLVTPVDAERSRGKLCGGAIVFGGGVPLYRGKTRIGGLGASGDTACADHEIAKRIRHFAGLDPEKGAYADDITFASADGPSPYAHPLCPNTWRNGQKLGDEAP